VVRNKRTQKVKGTGVTGAFSFFIVSSDPRINDASIVLSGGTLRGGDT
jgi:hypothetical protein